MSAAALAQVQAPPRARHRFRGWPSQVKFWELGRLRADGAQVKGYSAPIGTGKTRALCVEALRCAARNPGCVGIIGAPSFPMLRSVTIPELLAVLDERGIRREYNKSSHVLALPDWRAEIWFKYLSDANALRGPNIAWFGADELSLCDEESWQVMLGRVRDPKARYLEAFGGWTPKGSNFVHRMFVSREKVEHYQIVFGSPFENLKVLARNPRYYEDLSKSYDERFYRQEVLGEYLSVFAGQAYHCWSPENEREQIDWDPSAPLLWSLDFNVNPMTAVVAQQREVAADRCLLVLADLSIRDAGTEQMCEEFYSLTKPWRAILRAPLAVEVFGDPAGAARHSSASQSDWDIARAFFARHSRDYAARFRVAAAPPLVKDRVNVVNGLLRNSRGERRLFVASRAKGLIMDFEGVEWASDAVGNSTGALAKRNPKLTHFSDALGYMACELYPASRDSVRVVPDEPPFY